MKRPFPEALVEPFLSDIVIEILLRVPFKSLMRFKCVCKRWRSLISGPGFARSHLQRLKAGDMVASQRIFKTSPLETIDYEALDGGIGGGDHAVVVRAHELSLDDACWEPLLVGSCDGLVCLHDPGRFLLYNPSTRECRDLPGLDLFELDEMFIGFGYDPRSHDYKIVQGDDTGNGQVVIFSLRSGSWRMTPVQQENHLAVSEQGVYWNGALHWCVPAERRNKSETVIMSFDLSEEKFHQVLRAPEVNGDVVFEGLGVHGASLLLYHCTVINDLFEAWVTNDYKRGGSWMKLFSVLTDGVSVHKFVKIPAYTRSGKIVFQIDTNQMTLLNPEDDTYRIIPSKATGTTRPTHLYDEVGYSADDLQELVHALSYG
ncbi:F-box/kelch-repeat protein At3g06240 [Eucalyptus grandis]|uniref:F-box/kelch-repeat protein At3g06240 n=1 Tax=Eucalyptus grandis TaxID=71139 RepID=UPI00192EBCA4|nr:F-box/kelch-repeat protein At3g06240 [Eucalyptus grandis]